MNTPIISISEDQNTITHESGVVTVFNSFYDEHCDICTYRFNCSICKEIPCENRKDKKSGYFILKQ